MVSAKFLMFIPVIGRFIVEKELQPHRDSRIRRYLIFAENTLVYFFGGLLWFLVNRSFLDILFGALLIWFLAAPLEYELLQRSGKARRILLLTRRDSEPPSALEYFWAAYHAFWFLMFGSAVGIVLGG